MRHLASLKLNHAEVPGISSRDQFVEMSPTCALCRLWLHSSDTVHISKLTPLVLYCDCVQKVLMEEVRLCAPLFVKWCLRREHLSLQTWGYKAKLCGTPHHKCPDKHISIKVFVSYILSCVWFTLHWTAAYMCVWGQWPLLLTWFNFNPSMDK